MRSILSKYASLLALALWSSCAQPTNETVFPGAKIAGDPVFVSMPLPDTAGISGAYAAFLQTAPASERSRFSHPFWTLLTPVDTTNGVVPCSVFEDDSLGFQTVFYHKTTAGFLFQLIGSKPGGTVFSKRQTESVASLPSLPPN